MRAEDLGFNTETGTHSKLLTQAENVFVGILWEHVGRENRISADLLAANFDFCMRYPGIEYDANSGTFCDPADDDVVFAWPGGHEIELMKRHIRKLHNHLLVMHDKLPILSAAGLHGGYWLAESEDEAAAFFETFRKRGMTGLMKASRGRKAALVDMMQQLTFEFDELVDRSGIYSGVVRRRVSDPTPIDVVDAFLERMMANPEKFADGLRKIGQKYGGVLLPKEQLAALQAKTDELSALMDGLRIGG